MLRSTAAALEKNPRGKTTVENTSYMRWEALARTLESRPAAEEFGEMVFLVTGRPGVEVYAKAAWLGESAGLLNESSCVS